MRYTRETPIDIHKRSVYGKPYKCNHPIYNSCTLYSLGNKGLAVIQLRYNSNRKIYQWGAVEPQLADDIYMHAGFDKYFDEHADYADGEGIYPTVPVRQIMWALRMKPLPREYYEQFFR